MKYSEAKNGTIFCKRCGQSVKGIISKEGVKGTFFAKAVCPLCGDWLDWVGKPENENKRGKSSKYRPEDLDLDFCEMCGRNKDHLGKYEQLEIHHKIPINEGGKDEKSNILVFCTPCHRMAHFLRVYLRDHIEQLLQRGAHG